MPFAPNSKRRVLVLNAALNGREGNTAVLLRRAMKSLSPAVDVTECVLAETPAYADVREGLLAADAFVIGTGTHWDSWSHLLQKFLEDGTLDEGTPVWLGKPAAVLVTMHSVGGKAVLSRLQGVLNTLGCTLPPMSGLVYSLANQVARRADPAATDDLWSADDVDVVCHNLLVSLGVRAGYCAWDCDRTHFSARWISPSE